MFEIIDHTADVAFVVKAQDERSLIKDALDALHYIYFEKLPDRSDNSEKRTVKVEGINLEDAIISFLNEIVYIFDSQKLVFSGVQDIDVFYREDGEVVIESQLLFSKFSPEKHNPVIYVKAVTYGGANIKRDENNNLQMTLIVDI
ncbi:MAG: archease [Candidatus Calescibacterium sp.]|nr:archease [Candidatus Calescibacterium sp.]MCX7734726.1 archease [bacterium]MDW8087292.1 archease [Candidatus Calescibacterium sp.]